MKGYIHLYCGSGKGKTCSVCGLALRQVNLNRKIIFVQFLKPNKSGEWNVLTNFENVIYYQVPTIELFLSQMSQEQYEFTRTQQNILFNLATQNTCDASILIMDEIIDAINNNIIDLELFINFLRTKPDSLEVVLTGRNPHPTIIEMSDYYTHFECIKHPFNEGVLARAGIEY